MRYFLFFIASVLLVFSCTNAGKKASEEISQKEPVQEFMEKLKSFEGQSFYGKVLFPEKPEAPFNAETLFVIFESVSETEARMPFILGNDKSRTWMLNLTEDGLLFKHDHRHEDGTPEDITMYGGYADDKGSSFFQNFPADEETSNMMPETSTNVWTFKFNEEMTEFHYILERHNAPRFHVVFDLTAPIVNQ
jgi:hypothetical protein